jgi:Ca2+-binding RTX toxin-like protein
LSTGNENDIVSGDAGDDIVSTGTGNDSIWFSGTSDGFDAVNAGTGTDTISARLPSTDIGLSSVAGVEFITAGGNAGVRIVGSAGNDTLNFSTTVLTGIDSINGGAGNDTLTGSTAADNVSGDAGDDTISTLGPGNDNVWFTGAGDGFDAVTGGAGADTIIALSDGTDIGLRSLAQVETITANGHSGVRIAGSPGNDSLNFSAVTLIGIGSIDGGAGADTITGSGINDVIIGGLGTDNLNGGGLNDTLEGGADNDIMNGGTGNDLFRYLTGGFGADTINGFDANPLGGQDLIDLSGLLITNASFGSNVTIAASGGSTLITVAGQGTILLAGVSVANVTIGDFMLAL